MDKHIKSTHTPWLIVLAIISVTPLIKSKWYQLLLPYQEDHGALLIKS